MAFYTVSFPFKWQLTAIIVLLSSNTMLTHVRGSTVTLAAALNDSDDGIALLSWSRFTVQYKDRVILNLSTPGSVFQGRVLGLLGPSGLVIPN